MKKKVISCLLAAVMAASMAACGGQESAEQGENNSGTSGTSAQGSSSETAGDSTEAETPAADTLIVGFDSAFPPMGFVGDDGEYTGFDLDLAAAVADRLGMGIEYKPIDWNSKDMELDSGTINCIWNGFTMEGREDDYTFSEPYMINGQVIVARADSGIASFDDLAGKAVITQVDSAAYNVLAGDDATQADLAATFASLETIGDYNTAFMQLESGAVDAVACDLSISAYQLAAKPDAYVQLDEFLSEEHYAVGFKKGDDATAEAVNESLRAMDEDGFIQELCEKYSEDGISYENWCLE